MLKKTLTKNVYDCRANDLLNVVADVKSYTKFIPFCSDVEIYDSSVSEEIEHFAARLTINFKFTSENFETKVIKSEKPVIVDFWAPWCGPCTTISPVLEEISNEMPEVVIAKLNIDEELNTGTKYGIRGIPTMLLFSGGELKATKVGATTKSNIVSWIKENT